MEQKEALPCDGNLSTSSIEPGQITNQRALQRPALEPLFPHLQDQMHRCIMRDTQLYYCFFLKVAVEFSCHNLVARWLSRYLSSFRPTYLTGLLWGSKGNGMSWGLIWVGGYSDSIQEDEIYFLILYKSYNLRYADDTTLMAENEELKSLLMKVKEMKWSEVNSFSCVQLFETPWTVAFQALPPMGFSRQEYWSGLPFPSLENLPDPGIEPRTVAGN